MRYLILVFSLFSFPSILIAQDDLLEPGSFYLWHNPDLPNTFQTHRECEEHYYSCELQNVELQGAMTAIWNSCPWPAPEPQPEDFGCEVFSDFRDGPGGALWKPVSDNTRRPVFLLPGSYWPVTSQIEVLSINGAKLVDGRPRTCCPNGGRAHYDVPMSAGRLKDDAPIVVRMLVDGEYECRVVEDPTERND